MSTQSIINALAGLTPDTDKATLIKAVDDAVEDILRELENAKGGKPSNDVIMATQATLQFLEVCKDLKDPEFTEKTKERAKQLLTAFSGAQGGATANDAGAPKKKRRRKKRPDGKAAPKKGAAKKAAPRSRTEWEETEFTTAFAQHFCKYIRTRAMLWYVPQHDLTPTPFPLSSKFADNLETAIQQHFLYRFFSNRRILVLEDELKLQGYEKDAFYAEFDKPKKRNPIRTVWDDGLRDIKKMLSGEFDKAPEPAKSKVKTKKTGGIFGFFQKEEKVVERAAAEVDDTEMKQAHAFWNTIAGPEVTYDPPTMDDFLFLHCLFEYYPDQIESNQQAARQMLQQEHGSSEAREGAARDHLNGLITSSAECAGELTAMWAYLMEPKAFGPGVYKSFTSSHGTTPQQRLNALPYFQRWLPDYTEV